MTDSQEAWLTHSNLQVQRAYRRQTLLVAKVPIAALFTLILTNLLFVVTGIVLLVMAWKVRRPGVDDVQARLNITGLVADRFEDERRQGAVGKIEELFDEYQAGDKTRVAVVGTFKDGYIYDTL